VNTFAEAMDHGSFEEVLPDVFFVTGTKKGELMGSHWHFSRNMTVVRYGDDLTLINTVRLDEVGLAALDALGRVKHVARIGALHGMDDAFYVDRYQADYWAPAGVEDLDGLTPDHVLEEGGVTPFPGGSIFSFQQTNLPECILRVDREGGILVACDALQNWLAPDEFFSDESRQTMTEMGFFQPANIGPVWIQANDPKPQDFQRLAQLEYRHALCGHGQPLLNTAREDYAATFKRVFAD
jgi:hypothetical protein